jgi:hypothetical protein
MFTPAQKPRGLAKITFMLYSTIQQDLTEQTKPPSAFTTIRVL